MQDSAMPTPDANSEYLDTLSEWAVSALWLKSTLMQVWAARAPVGQISAQNLAYSVIYYDYITEADRQMIDRIIDVCSAVIGLARIVEASQAVQNPLTAKQKVD